MAPTLDVPVLLALNRMELGRSYGSMYGVAWKTLELGSG